MSTLQLSAQIVFNYMKPSLTRKIKFTPSDRAINPLKLAILERNIQMSRALTLIITHWSIILASSDEESRCRNKSRGIIGNAQNSWIEYVVFALHYKFVFFTFTLFCHEEKLNHVM